MIKFLVQINVSHSPMSISSKEFHRSVGIRCTSGHTQNTETDKH